MGMDAELLAIGPYNKNIAKYLEYNPVVYKDTPEGYEIITSVIRCETSSQSEYLTDILHIDPWKFDDHRIADQRIIVWINRLLDYEGRDFTRTVEEVQELSKAGFIFLKYPKLMHSCISINKPRFYLFLLSHKMQDLF